MPTRDSVILPLSNARAETSNGALIPAVAAPARAGDAPSLLTVSAERHAELAKLLARAQTSGSEGKSLSAEFVHDLRVATRRLEEAGGLLGDLTDKSSARVIEGSLKALRHSAGELRDLDVACEHLLAGGKWRMPAAVAAIAHDMAGDLRDQRGTLEEQLRQTAAAASVLGAMVILARTIEESRAESNGAKAESRLRSGLDKRAARREKKLRKAFGKAALRQTPEALHAARIAAKKLRYVLELADAAGGSRKKSQLKALKAIQKLLGEHHDVHVVEEMLGKKVAGEKVNGLPAQWRTWKKRKEREQARRAAQFFARSYAWMNA